MIIGNNLAVSEPYEIDKSDEDKLTELCRKISEQVETSKKILNKLKQHRKELQARGFNEELKNK